MKPGAIFSSAAALVSATHTTLGPRAEPTITRDPWQCATENITQYFDMPKPTGELLDALISYGNGLYKTCTFTDLAEFKSCTSPGQSRWCAFTTAAPSAVLPDYSAYGSKASSWWSVHSSAAISLASKCPVGWHETMMETPNGQTWLNDTLVFAGCYAEAHPTPETEFTTKGPGPMETGSGGGPEATTSDTPNSGALNRSKSIGMWMVAGIGLAGAAINFIL